MLRSNDRASVFADTLFAAHVLYPRTLDRVLGEVHQVSLQRVKVSRLHPPAQTVPTQSVSEGNVSQQSCFSLHLMFCDVSILVCGHDVYRDRRMIVKTQW